MSAVNFKLDNLVVIMDDNHLQAMDSVQQIMGIDFWTERWHSFGYDVTEINGHDIVEIEQALKQNNRKGVPRMIIANTVKGHGVSFMENVPIWHYRMPNKEELEIVKRELNITEEELRR